MVLKKFYFKEYTDIPNTWELDTFEFNEKVNLFVGQNATGKTRTINRMLSLARMIIGQPIYSLEIIDSANFEILLTDKQNNYIYSLATRHRNIVSEMLSINDKMKLKRVKDGTGELYYQELGKSLPFQVSDNKPVITTRQDSIQHPYLNSLFKWADGVRFYSFSSSREMGQRNMLATINPEEFSNGEFNLHETFRINELFLRAKKEFGETFEKEVTSSMNKIGYDISNLSVERNPFTAITDENVSPLFMLCVKENDRNAKLYQTGMSQGMFRALSLLIQVIYNVMNKISSTILIDDIGEGLDFERSTKLIKLLIDLAENNENIQLIMSTNDRFVMNNVPLEYWQVIQRTGGKCKVYNDFNAKEIFDEFVYTGLNNFDFLATDFINSREDIE